MDDKILELVSENPFSILVNDDNYFTNISLTEILKAYNLVYIVVDRNSTYYIERKILYPFNYFILLIYKK